MNNLLKGAALVVGGAVLGAAAVMLLAPKASEEARQQVADMISDAKKKVQDYCEQVKQDLANINVKAQKEEQEA